MSYTPQPGTIAYRAIAWLERQPAGHEVTASMWAEAIGYTDGDTLRNCIVPALHAGLVKRRTRDGMSRPEWYSLGDGKPPAAAAPADEDTTDPLPVRTHAPEVKPHAGEVLPGLKVPSWRETLGEHARLDVQTGRKAQPQDEAVADALAVAEQPQEGGKSGVWPAIAGGSRGDQGSAVKAAVLPAEVGPDDAVVVASTPEAKPEVEPEYIDIPKPSRYVMGTQAQDVQLTSIEQRAQAARNRLARESASERCAAKPPAFDAWLSAMTGELCLQGVQIDEDGDLVLTEDQVDAVRRLLCGGVA